MANSRKKVGGKRRGSHDEEGLTIQWRLFVEAITGPSAFNEASEAARQAGYADTGKPGTIGKTAHRVMEQPAVQRAIARRLAQRCITPEFARERTTEIARSSLADFASIDEKGNFSIDWLKAQAAGALGTIREYSEIPTKYGIAKKIRLHDPLPALALLARMLGMVKDAGSEISNADFIVDETLASASPPLGAIPALPEPDTLQGGSGGEAERQD